MAMKFLFDEPRTTLKAILVVRGRASQLNSKGILKSLHQNRQFVKVTFGNYVPRLDEYPLKH